MRGDLHNLHPDALSADQIDRAVTNARPVRWWVPTMWWGLLGLALSVGGLWIWRDADHDLARDSDPRLVSTAGVVQGPVAGGGSYRGRVGTMSVPYTFNVGGLTYVGSRVSAFDGLSAENTAALSRLLQIGASVMIKYDPTDPAINFLDAGSVADLSQERSTARQNRVIGLFVAVAGLAVLGWAGWIWHAASEARRAQRAN